MTQMTEEEAMTLIKATIDMNRVNLRLGLLEENPFVDAIEIVYDRAACNIGLEQIMSAKTDEGDNDE